MAKSHGLHCAVITPERLVVEADVDSIVLPAHDGLIGILRNRAPLLCEVGIGVLTLTGGEVGVRELFVDGGFAQVLDNEVSILTTRAQDPAQIDRQAAATALEAARQMKITDEPSFDARQKAIARAKTQISLAS